MKVYRMSVKKWFLERVVYMIAGVFVFGSVVLGVTVSEKFFYFTGLVGFMLIGFALTGYCPMAIVLDRAGVKSGIVEQNVGDVE